MRIMGLDVGSVRIGIALSDKTRTIAQSFKTITRSAFDSDIQALKKIAIDNDVSHIVIGLPLNMDGTLSKQTEAVLEFSRAVQEKIGLPVDNYDERLTSKEAESALILENLSRRKRKQKIDKVAACLILQNYLEYKSKG
ncbi:MAG: Holliday junction resolvase RuvX [Candidatus Omnitrophica bacterium]|nr:Holliday junction resolvase RuvX [Candidatus Omnitrophota bacterium]